MQIDYQPYVVALKTFISVAIGGATGSMVPVMQQLIANGNLNHIDWHNAAQTALYGAILAVWFHYQKSPIAPPPQPPAIKNAPARLLDGQ